MTQREWTADDYLVLLRRWRILIVVCAIVGAALAYGVSRFLPNRYKSQTTILVEQPEVPDKYVSPVVSDDANQRLISIKQQILSRTRLEPLVHQFGLFSGEVNRMPMDELVGKLQAAIAVTPIQPVGDNAALRLPAFTISVTLDTPHAAQDVCTAIASMFIAEDTKQRTQGSENTTEFMSQELAQAQAKLNEQDQKLADFEAHHIGSLPDQIQTNFGLLSGLYSRLDATTQGITRAQLDKNLTQSTLAQQIAARKASQTGKNPETYEEQLSALQTQLATLQSRYTDDYPDVIKAKIAIEALKQKIAASDDLNKNADFDPEKKTPGEPLEFSRLRAQIRQDDQIIAENTKQQEQIQEQIKSINARVQASPLIEQEYKGLTRDYQTALEFYRELLNKRDRSAMAVDLERRQQGESFKVLDPANLPNDPDFPNRLQFAAGGLGGGLVLGLGLAFLMEMRDTSLRTERDVETFLRLPVLAMVPAVPRLSEKAGKPVAQLLAASDGGFGAKD